MPITPGHQWQESPTWVSIDVKIPNVTTSSANIMTTECYVNVNCAPYFFEADLCGEVDVDKSKACVGQGAVSFFLVKKDQGLWERLTMLGDRQEKLDRRQRSQQLIREQREKLRKEYPAKFSNIGRLAVGEQMRMEEMKREVIEQRKQAEHLMEQEKIESWKKGLTKQSNSFTEEDGKAEHSNVTCDSSRDGHEVGTAHNPDGVERTSCLSRMKNTNVRSQFARDYKGDQTSHVGHSLVQEQGTFKTIRGLSRESETNTHETSLAVEEGHLVDELEEQDPQTSSSCPPTSCNGSPRIGGGSTRPTSCKVAPRNGGSLRYAGTTLPAPRNSSVVSVTFSPKPDLPRHLPARESRDKEIKLQKSGKVCVDALDVSERAPLFLQDKGDKFFKAGDYQSAVNAYTNALAKDPSLVMSFINRGACKLHLKEYQSCVQDCTSALCILTGGTSDCIQENILAQSFSLSSEAEAASSQHSDATPHSGKPVSEMPSTAFPVDSLGLLSCLSGQGCCSMRGLSVEGAGVEEWKRGMRKHVYIRRGTARYHLGNLSKASDDFAKANQIEPVNEEVERILVSIKNELATSGQ